MNILTNLNLNKNELQNAVIQSLTTAPASPVAGQIYYNSTDALIYRYDGTNWAAVGSVLSVNGETGTVVLTQDDVGNGTTYKQTHNDYTDALKTLTENAPKAIADEYDSTATYAVGDFCTHEGLLYKCTTAIGTAEAWTAGHWTAVTVADTFAPLASPAFTGTPTAPTPTAGDNSTKLATTEFVTTAVGSLNEAMMFKGTLGSGGTATALPATHKAGWTYKVITAGTYAGQTCEVGDLVICVTDGTSANDAHWTVAQTNIDGAVTGPAGSTDGHIPTFSGTTGKLIADGYGVSTTIAADDDTKLATEGAVYGLIAVATGTIGTSATTATVNYSGTLINAYATMGGDIVGIDTTVSASSVVFTCGQNPSSAVTCTVVYRTV